MEGAIVCPSPNYIALHQVLYVVGCYGPALPGIVWATRGLGMILDTGKESRFAGVTEFVGGLALAVVPAAIGFTVFKFYSWD
jgi:hypothetical protein